MDVSSINISPIKVKQKIKTSKSKFNKNQVTKNQQNMTIKKELGRTNKHANHEQKKNITGYVVFC